MTDASKPVIRFRTNPAASDTADAQRLISEAPLSRKKRQPNSGSWTKGVSPNPKGRPKGAKGLKTIARKILSEKVTVRSATGPRKVRLVEGLMRKEVELAVSGDWRARRTILELSKWALGDIAETPGGERAPAPEELSPTDQAILDMFAEEILSQSRLTGKQPGKEA